MNNRYLTLSEFAAALGRSRQAVYKAHKSGLFPSAKIDGKLKVDLKNREVLEYAKDDLDIGQVPGKKKSKPKTVKQKPTPPKQEKPAKKKDTSGTEPIPEDIYNRLDSGEMLTNKEIVNMPKAWVEKIKIYEQTKQITQKRLADRKELISRRIHRFMLGKLFEIHMNEFMSLRDTLVYELAGRFGCKEQEKIFDAGKFVDEELWKILNHVKIEFNRHLERYDAEVINEPDDRGKKRRTRKS
jgi:predicted DNA-binding transcriptional regulator AlpA